MLVPVDVTGMSYQGDKRMYEVSAQTMSGRVWRVGRTDSYAQAIQWVGMVHESSDDLATIFQVNAI